MSTFSDNQSVKLTKTVIDKIKPPVKGQAFVRDGQLKGFAVRITASGNKSFIVEKRINGRVKRMTLGRFGELTVEQARKQAQITLGKIAMGLDPVAEQQRARLKGVNLTQAYAEFAAVRSLKPKTRYDYDRLMVVAFKKWARTPITAITKTMVRDYYLQLGAARGESYANLSMRFLRALMNFAIANYTDNTGQSILQNNPVSILSQAKIWFKTERRQTVIKPHQLPIWHQALQGLKARDDDTADTVADFLLLLLFTGLRREEALNLRWVDIDLNSRSLTVSNTKNGDIHTLPLSDFLVTFLTERWTRKVNDYVFPGRAGKGRLIEPKRHIKKVVEDTGVIFMPHDLRRTFITVAESIDVSPYSIKRLVNHRIHNDVTSGYIITDLERLRGPMQKITDFLVSALGINNEVKVLPLHRNERK